MVILLYSPSTLHQDDSLVCFHVEIIEKELCEKCSFCVITECGLLARTVAKSFHEYIRKTPVA